jgi:hypothetical protein
MFPVRCDTKNISGFQYQYINENLLIHSTLHIVYDHAMK